jgi:hypothetical protein
LRVAPRYTTPRVAITVAVAMGEASPEKRDGERREHADRIDAPARDDEPVADHGGQLERDAPMEPGRPDAVKYVPL